MDWYKKETEKLFLSVFHFIKKVLLMKLYTIISLQFAIIYCGFPLSKDTAEFAESTYETILETVFTNSSDLFSNESFPKFSIDKDMRKSISEQCAREEKIHSLYKFVQSRVGDILPKPWLLKHLKSCHPPNQNTEKINQPLCRREKTIVYLNSEYEEYVPSSYVEIRCKNLADYERNEGRTNMTEQTCLKVFRCVQQYEDLHFARRTTRDRYWSSFTIPEVPRSCECMRPITSV
ncbi:hypothetical protein ACH3XW_0720 [Acanthocheilonema viteae]